jgi:hypothetical protein
MHVALQKRALGAGHGVIDWTVNALKNQRLSRVMYWSMGDIDAAGPVKDQAFVAW